VNPAGDLFYDDLSRATNPAPLLPWVGPLGTWSITNSQLLGGSGSNSYGHAYYCNGAWTDYAVQARVQFSSTNGFGGGIGGRLDPASGAHYAAWLYPDGSIAGGKVLKLIKFEQWGVWSFNPMAVVNLPGVGTNAHTLTMNFQSNQITVYLDGALKINAADNLFDQVPPFLAGGISADMFTLPNPYTLGVDHVIVATNGAPLLLTQPQGETNSIGATAQFTVTSLGGGPLSYQWFLGGSNSLTDGGRISGSSSATLIISNLMLSDSGAYSVVVTNAFGSITSSNAVLDVVSAPEVQSVSLVPGGVILTWTAVPGQTYRVQYKDDLANPAWNPISPDLLATAPTLTLTNSPVASMQRFYRVLLVP
jgi:hypothetical protein